LAGKEFPSQASGFHLGGYTQSGRLFYELHLHVCTYASLSVWAGRAECLLYAEEFQNELNYLLLPATAVQVQSTFNNFSEITCGFIQLSVRAQLNPEQGPSKHQLIGNIHRDWQPDANIQQKPCLCKGRHPQELCIKLHYEI